MAHDNKKRCFFKANNIQEIDYKDVKLLQRFLTFQGKILPSRITSVSKKYQNKLKTAVKRARQAGLLGSKT
jgi:small subunit ribosomal protein S18